MLTIDRKSKKTYECLLLSQQRDKGLCVIGKGKKKHVNPLEKKERKQVS